MIYQLDYTVYREYESCPGMGERERGAIEFADVHTAQEWCESPAAMCLNLNADSGHFAMRCGERPYEWEWLWEVEYDFERTVNRTPLAYRVWRDAIFNMEEVA